MMKTVAKYSHKLSEKNVLLTVYFRIYVSNKHLSIFQFSSQCHHPRVTSLLFIPVLPVTAVYLTLFSTQSEFCDDCLCVQERMWKVRLINFHCSVVTACIFIHQLV